jgi:PAS domain S-box-containing protein
LSGEDLKLLEQLGAGLAIVDPTGQVVLWNDDAARILGIAARDALGTPWVDCLTLIRGDDTGGATLRVEILQMGGWHGPLQVRTRDGRTLWLRAHVQPIRLPEFAGKPGVAAMFWDGEGPDRAVSGPEAAQLPYRDLFVNSPEALFLTDLAGVFVDANEAAAAILGTTPRELVGKTLSGFLVGRTDADASAELAELLASGSMVRHILVQPVSGDPFPAQLIASLATQIGGGYGYTLVRMLDRTQEEHLERLFRNLADLSRPGDRLLEVEEVAQRALEIVATDWGAGASVAILDGPAGFSLVAGSSTPEAIRATLSGVDPARSPLALLVKDATAPFELDLSDPKPPAWAVRARALGLGSLRATPLWFDDHRIGAMVLLWAGDPPSSLDMARLGEVGRHVGSAIGTAETHWKMRSDAELRESLTESARIGGVVVEQMTDAIVTTDANGRITAVNPAGERLYGLSEEEAVGRRLDEALEQLGLDGSPLGTEATAQAGSMGYWHGRVVHRPLIGSLAGRHLVVDLSLTSLRDDQHKPAGLILMSHEVATSAHLESEAAALGSLAVATGRARSRREVAEAALERLCEAMMADVGIIVTWGDKGPRTIEASRGLSQESLDVIREANIPELGSALQTPGAVIAFESLGAFLDRSEVATVLAKEGLTTGFLVDLRSLDESVGFLALGARRPTWGRPSDEVVLQAAAQVVSALENARLMERLEQGLKQERRLTAQLETLIGLTLLPPGEIDENTLALFLLERVVGALGADGGVAVRTSDDGLRVVASHRIPPGMAAVLQARPADEFHFWRRLSAQPDAGAYHQLLAEVATEGGRVQEMIAAGVASYAVFPVRDGDRLIAAFLCFFRDAGDTVSEADVRTIDAVGRIISIAYANVRMSEGLNEAAEHERRLTAELRALQELTLLGASTDDLSRLAQETIEAVVVSTGAAGGGYILVDPSTSKVDPIVWVGQSSRSWAAMSESPTVPDDWPPFERLGSEEGVWLSRTSETGVGSEGGERAAGAQAVLPLRVDEKLAGVLHLEWAASPRVEQFDDHFLEPIARICSISLANFRLRSELLHRAAAQRALGHRLDTLDELTRIGEEASSFEELAHRTVSLVREALGAAGVCYLLIEPGHHFETHAVAGETGAFRLWLKGAPAKEAPGGAALLSGSGSVMGDFVATQVSERVLPLARATGFKSFGAIPIRTGEELAGALLCFFEQTAAALPVDEAAFDSVARIGGIALANFRLRERLVSSEERYRTLFEESPDALFVSALDGTVLDANEAAVRLYHVNRGEVLGRYFGQLVSADEREMARRRQVVWAQGRGTFGDRGRRPDASEFPVEVEVRVVELGGQRRFLSLVRDLSDQERLTNELLQAQKMEAIGQLVSGVAHELNNPLAAIIAFSQLIRGDQRLPEDMKHDAGLLVQEADRTRRIVQNLLDFARQRPPERRPTNIATLVRSVLELQSYALSTNRVQVAVDIPDDLPEVDLDRAQMQQVLLNLTINAIQAFRTRDRATQAHLWVTATATTTGRGPGGPKAEKLADVQQRVRITIRDDGPGVPEAARVRLFDPFFTTKQPGEGTGLGLSVSFGIVAAHDGHLWYEPGPGNFGSCFMIELPVRAKPMNERQLAAALEAATWRVTQLADGAPVEAGPAEAEPEKEEKPTKRGRGAAPAAPAAPTDRSSPGGARQPAAMTRSRGAAAPAAAPVESAPPAALAADPAALATPAAPPAAAPAAPAPAPVLAAPAAASSPLALVPGSAVPPIDRLRILALDDEPSIRAFLKKVLASAGMDCDPYQDGAQALEGLRDMTYDVMLIDHRMAGMSGTEFYDAAIEFRPELAKRAVFMSGDVLNPDLRGFATQRGIRLLAKPFDIEAVTRVVHEAISAAEEAERQGH